MKMGIYTQVVFFFLFFSSFSLLAQNESIVIDSIFIEGNKKTKGHIIFRELLFKAGDTIQLTSFPEIIERSEQNILNTSLFTQVTLNIKNWKNDNLVNVQIAVSESWFFFPSPIFELADRNFNVWWVDQNKSLKRINLGLRLKYLNMSGHRDLLKLTFHTGYTQKYELEYGFPYLNKNKTIGVFGNILYAKNKEINYKNEQNKQLFRTEMDLDLFQRFRIKGGLSYRPNFYLTHFLRLEYHSNTIDQFVLDNLNNEYFGNQETTQKYGVIEYLLELDRRDLKIYPLKGSFFQTKLRKIGLTNKGQNHIVVKGLFQKSIPLLRKSAITNQSIFQTIIEFNPISFNLSKAHGFGEDYLRGYELYVIDGQTFFLNKTKGKWNLIDRKVNWKKWMPIKAYKIMPLALYISTNFDFGYVKDKYFQALSPLSNRWLYGFGIGLDLILYNNYAYTIEYSYNQFNEKGIFLHFNVGL